MKQISFLLLHVTSICTAPENTAYMGTGRPIQNILHSPAGPKMAGSTEFWQQVPYYRHILSQSSEFQSHTFPHYFCTGVQLLYELYKCDARAIFLKAELSFASDRGKLHRKRMKCSKQLSEKISRRRHRVLSGLPKSNLKNLQPKITSVHSLPPLAEQPETYRKFAKPTRPTD